MRYALLMLIPFLAVVSSCENRVNSPAPAGFNKQPTLLMTLPAGYEAREVTFSKDGFYVAAVLEKDGKMHMRINSVLSAGYDSVLSPVFHVESKQYAFVASKDGKACVVLNGKEGPFYDSIKTPLITPGGMLIYAATKNGKWFIVSGDKVSQGFDSSDPSLHASPDGKRLAFIEQNSATGKVNLRTCTSMLKEYARGREYDQIADVINSVSGSHLAYRVVKNGKKTVVQFDFRQPGCAEKEGLWYDNINNFALSNNGEHLAFFGTKMEKHYLVSASNEWPCTDYNMLFDISVSDKGNVLYTGAIEYSIILSLDGKVIADRRESIDNLTFSGDSNNYLFIAGPCPFIPTDKPVEFGSLVINDKESKKYDKIVNPRFSPDDTHVVFRARSAGQRFVVVANKTGQIVKEHQPYEAVWDYTFSPDGKYIGYGVRTGRELWWKVEPVK